MSADACFLAGAHRCRVDTGRLLVEASCEVGLAGLPEGVGEQLPAVCTPACRTGGVALGDSEATVLLAFCRVASGGVGSGEPRERPGGVEGLRNVQQRRTGGAQGFDRLGEPAKRELGLAEAARAVVKASLRSPARDRLPG